MFLEWLRRNQNVVVPVALFLASITLLSYESYDPRNQRMSIFSRMVVDTLSLGQRAVSGATHGVQDLWRNYFWLVGVEDENDALRREVEQLRRQNTALITQALENVRLRRLLLFQPTEEIKTWIPAEVIGESPPGMAQTITINKGSRDGIRPRMAVITYDSALVGQILDEPGSEIDFLSSRALLLTDRRSRVNVMVQRPESRAKGILAGRPETKDCELLYLEPLADIRVGDLLISSGYGQVFRKGWPAGIVREIINDPSSLSPRISVEPVANFSKLEEVMVIVPAEETP